MTPRADPLPATPSVEGVVNYAGRIVGPPRLDVHEPQRMNLAFRAVDTTIHDARSQPEAPSLATAGFELMEHRSPVGKALDRSRDPELIAAYHAEMSAVVQEHTGADLVVFRPGSLVIRRSEVKEGLSQTAAFAHLDFSAASIGQWVRWLEGWTGHDLTVYPRLSVVQTWRVLSDPPQDNLLALCDGRTVAASDTIGYLSVLGPADEPGRVFESRMGVANPAHRWCYFPDMHDDEVILFVGWDSVREDTLNVLHTGFALPPDGRRIVPRASVEARYFAFFRS